MCVCVCVHVAVCLCVCMCGVDESWHSLHTQNDSPLVPPPGI